MSTMTREDFRYKVQKHARDIVVSSKDLIATLNQGRLPEPGSLDSLEMETLSIIALIDRLIKESQSRDEITKLMETKNLLNDVTDIVIDTFEGFETSYTDFAFTLFRAGMESLDNYSTTISELHEILTQYERNTNRLNTIEFEIRDESIVPYRADDIVTAYTESYRAFKQGIVLHQKDAIRLLKLITECKDESVFLSKFNRDFDDFLERTSTIVKLNSDTVSLDRNYAVVRAGWAKDIRYLETALNKVLRGSKDIRSNVDIINMHIDDLENSLGFIGFQPLFLERADMIVQGSIRIPDKVASLANTALFRINVCLEDALSWYLKPLTELKGGSEYLYSLLKNANSTRDDIARDYAYISPDPILTAAYLQSELLICIINNVIRYTETYPVAHAIDPETTASMKSAFDTSLKSNISLEMLKDLTGRFNRQLDTLSQGKANLLSVAQPYKKDIKDLLSLLQCYKYTDKEFDFDSAHDHKAKAKSLVAVAKSTYESELAKKYWKTAVSVLSLSEIISEYTDEVEQYLPQIYETYIGRVSKPYISLVESQQYLELAAEEVTKLLINKGVLLDKVAITDAGVPVIIVDAVIIDATLQVINGTIQKSEYFNIMHKLIMQKVVLHGETYIDLETHRRIDTEINLIEKLQTLVKGNYGDDIRPYMDELKSGNVDPSIIEELLKM